MTPTQAWGPGNPGPHATAVAPTLEAVDDEPLDDLDVVGDILNAIEAMARGGRIETKIYKNLDGSERRYYVFRWEAKHSDGSRYRPTRYIGLTPGARPERIGPDDRIAPAA